VGKGMAKDTDSLKLTDRQKTRLLHLALCPPDPSVSLDGDEERGDLLHDLLRCSLPLHAGSHGERDGAAMPSSQGLRSVAGPPIGESLQDPKTSVAVLRDIKQYAKARGSLATSEREKDVFLAIYFGAIAAALVCHKERITGHTGQDLTRFFRFFAKAAWVPSPLGDLFAKAAECCAR
jgi:hypothetical protein